jgi:hypothetical protein
MIKSHFSNRRLRMMVGLLLAAGFVAQVARALNDRNPQPMVVAQKSAKPRPNEAIAAPVAPVRTERDIEAWAKADPIGLFEHALKRCERSIRDYRCTFTKQELVGGRMTEAQVMKAMLCEKPFSVRLEWVENEDKASRVLYVEDRWVKDGKQMAVAEPGFIARLIVPYVMRPIHGKDAERSSRRTIDQFGVRNSLKLILKYCHAAKEQGVLEKFEYTGKGEVDGRETLIFERHLPYHGEDGFWPDRVLVVHLDRELLLPTLVVAYGDVEKQQLLGLYKTTDLDLNPNLDDSVFTKKGMGL